MALHFPNITHFQDHFPDYYSFIRQIKIFGLCISRQFHLVFQIVAYFLYMLCMVCISWENPFIPPPCDSKFDKVNHAEEVVFETIAQMIYMVLHKLKGALTQDKLINFKKCGWVELTLITR